MKAILQQRSINNPTRVDIPLKSISQSINQSIKIQTMPQICSFIFVFDYTVHVKNSSETLAQKGYIYIYIYIYIKLYVYIYVYIYEGDTLTFRHK